MHDGDIDELSSGRVIQRERGPTFKQTQIKTKMIESVSSISDGEVLELKEPEQEFEMRNIPIPRV